MVEAVAAIFAAYAAHAGWPWWWASVAGAVSGFQVALARAYGGPLRSRIEAGDRSVARPLVIFSLAGTVIGAVVATAIYYGTGWVLSLSS